MTHEPLDAQSGTRGAVTLRQTRILWLIAVVVIVVPLGILVPVRLGRHGTATAALMGGKGAPAELEIATLVLREGLECVLVLATVTAGLQGANQAHRLSIGLGAGIGFAATFVTWRLAVCLLNDIGRLGSALALQAATGLLAIAVLLVVMNWFLHKFYWTGWISLHQRKKQHLLRAAQNGGGPWGVCGGMALLGFTSLYREGFEVVLFLQSYRLKLGSEPVVRGVTLGMLASGIVAAVTFLAHRHLPYRRMLIVTGVMLAIVLLVMVGEEAQEMQLAGWIPTTTISCLASATPSWMNFWFSVIPTRETLGAQALAGLLVFGSYIGARFSPEWRRPREAR
ncbi:MAG TPA: FTR1 family protein [Candidatus Sulfotelmatobacter sp.]|nr:FTR1 family protein [Candidatus Sulfotelmatobacter sp.]